MKYISTLGSPLGKLLLGSDGEHLTDLRFMGQKHFPDISSHISAPDLPVFANTKQWLQDYFSGLRPDPKALPLSPAGSDFQRRVWALLAEIPYGETVTYGELAMRLGSSARAVGGAVGRNPISIILPCHRVLGAGGALTGFDGGIDKKIWLLRHEGAHFQLPE